MLAITEHNIERRGRSSKFIKAYEYCGYDPELMLLLDDSIDNCKDWKGNNGKTILYRRVTDAEKSAKIERTEYNRIVNFTELDDAVRNIYVEVNSKVKRIGGKKL